MPLNDSSLASLSGLIEAIYSTVADATRWPEVLRCIGEAVTGTQTLLFATEPDGAGLALRCGDTPDDVLYPFLEHYASVNILSAPCDRMFGDGAARFSHVAVPDAIFEHSEFYQDFFRTNDLYYSMGVKCAASGGASTYLSIQRPWDLAPFSGSEGTVAALLMPHIRQALALQQRVQAQAAGSQTAERALEAFGTTVLGIDRQGYIRYANPAAERLLAKGTLLLQVNGRLCAKHTATNQALQRKLRSVLDLDAAFVGGRHEALVLADPNGHQDLRLVILPQRAHLPGFDPAVHAVVSITRVGDRALPRGSLLASLYELSPTECRIADLLLAGEDTQGIGDALRLTRETVRFYVKRILAKTGTHRQAELLALMLTLPGA